jgi:hypothetical protein
MRLGAAPLALIVFLACPAAIAQGQAPNLAPAATTPPPAAPAPPATAERGRHADARVCLEFPTELQVIACAEKYRWAKSR